MARVSLLRPTDIPSQQQPLAELLQQQGAFINIYRAMANAPVAFQRFIEFASVLWSGEIPTRTAEIAILVVVSESRAEYPLAWHIGDGAAAGLTQHEIRALVSGDDMPFSAEDAAVIRFARDMTINSRVSDDVFAAVASFLTEKQLVELALLVGLYRLVAATANTLQVDLDQEAASTLDLFRRGELSDLLTDA